MIKSRKIIAIQAECPLDPNGLTLCTGCKYYNGLAIGERWQYKVRCKYQERSNKK